MLKSVEYNVVDDQNDDEGVNLDGSQRGVDAGSEDASGTRGITAQCTAVMLFGYSFVPILRPVHFCDRVLVYPHTNHITCRHLINPSFLIASPPPWPFIAAAKCVERLLTTKIRHLESELTRMKLELSRRGTELSDMGGKYEQSEERRRDLAAVVTRLEEDLAVAQGSDASQGGHQGHDQSSLAQVMHVSVCFIWDWFRERCV